MGYFLVGSDIKGRNKLRSCARHGQGHTNMANSNNYLAILGLAVVGALSGIGHFGGLNETFFGSDNESEYVAESYHDDSYSSGYDNEITFRGKGTNSDGYITQGNIYLERVISGISDKFYLFNKGVWIM